MTQKGPLRWLSGAGWLVLGGGGNWEESETAEMDDRALALADFTLPVVYLPTAAGSLDQGEALIEYYADMGGPNGYVVPILDPMAARDPVNVGRIADAGLVYIGDGDALQLTQVLWQSPALDAIVQVFSRGAVIIGAGAGAAALGAWVMGEVEGAAGGPGWGWLPDVVVAPGFSGAENMPILRAVLRTQQGLHGFGIPRGSALALGPRGEVETWGEGDITFVLAQ
jgi:cyanophycinase